METTGHCSPISDSITSTFTVASACITLLCLKWPHKIQPAIFIHWAGSGQSHRIWTRKNMIFINVIFRQFPCIKSIAEKRRGRSNLSQRILRPEKKRKGGSAPNTLIWTKTINTSSYFGKKVVILWSFILKPRRGTGFVIISITNLINGNQLFILFHY